MDFSYALTPFLTWLIAGISKFIINSIKTRQLAFDRIGYGGLPSNHSAIVSSMVALIALKEGIGHPSFGVAITLSFIVIIDANSLRKQVGNQATIINKLAAKINNIQALRESIGHSRLEIFAGIILGIAVAAAVFVLLG